MSSSSGGVAIIGAGLAGLTARYYLATAGVHVETFEKGRGPGGRTTRRRAETREFDHGAQYFTARTPEFIRLVKGWLDDGTVEPWYPRIGTLRVGRWTGKPGGPTRYVGVPGMNQPAKNLDALGDNAGAAPVRLRTRITEARREGDTETGVWRLKDAEHEWHGPYGSLIVTVPPPQALTVLPPGCSVRNLLQEIEVDPCWAVMATFDPPLALEWDAAFVESDILAWAARNSSKPGRPPGDAWVLHGSTRWSRDNIEAVPEEVCTAMVREFLAVSGLGADTSRCSWSRAHRWRFSRPRPREEEPTWSTQEQLGLAGDAFGEGRVEGAFRSGYGLAERLLAEF